MMKALLLLALVAAAAAAPENQDKAAATEAVPISADEPVPISETAAPTVVDLAIAKNLTGLLATLQATQLEQAFGPDFVGTVFAPSNDAFDALAALLPASGIRVTTELIAKVLKYHALNGTVLTSEELEDGQALATIAGETLLVERNGSAVFLVDVAGNKAEVVEVDLEAGDAVVHIIDRVLLPLPLPTAAPLPEDITAETPTAAPAPPEVAAPSTSAASGLAASSVLALAALAAALLA